MYGYDYCDYPMPLLMGCQPLNTEIIILCCIALNECTLMSDLSHFIFIANTTHTALIHTVLFILNPSITYLFDCVKILLVKL